MSKPKASALIAVCPTFDGKPYTELDCQAYVEACLKKIGIDKNLAGSNAWFRYVKQNGWVGTPEECKKRFGRIPAGAFLFILKRDGKEPAKYKDGIGNCSHIGIYTGTGEGAWHSSASRGCVCESKFSGKTINGGWNMVGLWDELDYDGTADDGTADETTPDGGETMTAKVYSTNGLPVKMRAKPSATCSTYWELQPGTEVTVLETGNVWTKITDNLHTGYMMTAFLQMGEEEAAVNKADLEKAYNLIEQAWDILGDFLGKRG